MTDVEELKESQRRVEAKLNDLIAHNQALRRAHALAEIENLRARHYQTLLKLVVLQKMIKKKSEFLFLPVGIHSVAPMGCGLLQVLVDEQTAIEFEAERL